MATAAGEGDGHLDGDPKREPGGFAAKGGLARRREKPGELQIATFPKLGFGRFRSAGQGELGGQERRGIGCEA